MAFLFTLLSLLHVLLLVSHIPTEVTKNIFFVFMKNSFLSVFGKQHAAHKKKW